MQRLIYHPEYNLYNLGKNHPFSPLRNEMTFDLWKRLWGGVDYVEPELISSEIIKRVHDAGYVEIVEALSKGKSISDAESYGLGTADNPITKGMAEGARRQCAGTLLGAELLLEGKAKKILQLGGGFHHAHYNYASGFCVYNDLALAIKEMTDAGWHVLYLDIDVHHGDGVQELFYSDGSVLTISIHESGEYLFPGSGWLHQLGQGSGRALKLNFPLEPFTEGESYINVMSIALEESLSYFRPDAVVIQAGADAHFSDPLADLMLTTDDYRIIFEKIIQLTEKYANGRMLFTLGGGYSMNAVFRVWTILYALLFDKEVPGNLPGKWAAKWSKITGAEMPQTLFDPPNSYEPVPRRERIVKSNRELIQRFRDAVAPYWF